LHHEKIIWLKNVKEMPKNLDGIIAKKLQIKKNSWMKSSNSRWKPDSKHAIHVDVIFSIQYVDEHVDEHVNEKRGQQAERVEASAYQ